MRVEKYSSHLSLLTFHLFLVFAVHAVFEILNTFAQPTHELRDLPATEYQQYNQSDEKNFLVADK